MTADMPNVQQAERQILDIVSEYYDDPDNDRYGSITDRLIAAEDIRRAAVAIAAKEAADRATAYAVHVVPPDANDPEPHWLVVGDLREIIELDGNGESMNYAVRDLMVADNWSLRDLDPEYSCFFGYATSEAGAIELRDTAIRFANQIKAERS